MAPNKKALGANSGGLFTREIWRARRDSNPRPPDPKSGSRRDEQLESIRAWNGHREDAVFVDSGVSLDPALERVLIPPREPRRVRCPRRNRLPSNAHGETQDCTPRRGPNRRGDPVGGTGTKTSVSLDVVLFGTCGMHHARPRLVRGRRRLYHSGAPDTAEEACAAGVTAKVGADGPGRAGG